MARVTANGLQIEVEQYGNRSSVPFLLIRGLGSQIIHWPDRLIAGLVDAGFRVIAYDNRDAGLSQKFDDAGAPDIDAVRTGVAIGAAVPVPYTLRDMAADGVGVLDALDIDRAHVLGISMGGMILQIMARHYPERVTSATIVMSSSGSPDLPPAAPEITDLLNTRPPATDRESVVAHTLLCDEAWASPLYPFNKADRRRLIERAYDRCYCPDGTMRQLAAIVADETRHMGLADLDLPVLIIHGTDDTLVPVAHGKDLAERIPGSTFFAIKGMGHDLEGAVPGLIVSRFCELVAGATRL